MSRSSIVVTGASGHLGRRVVELLLSKEAGPIIALTRKPESLRDFAARGVEVRKADFDDPASLPAAFAGAERVLLISTDALDRPHHRVEQQLAAVKAMQAAGVKHVVYTSLPNADASLSSIAPDHVQTEKAIAAAGLGYTILRNNLYTDLLLATLPGALASGKLVDARPTGAEAHVTREDCAQAAAAALADRGFVGQRTLDVTGPEALTGVQLAAIVSEVTGKRVEHVGVPYDALVAGMVEHGLPEAVAHLYASFDKEAETGGLSRVTDTVQMLTGRTPQSVKAFLTEHRAALLKT